MRQYSSFSKNFKNLKNLTNFHKTSLSYYLLDTEGFKTFIGSKTDLLHLGDVVFITSDGVSDNFDPVVGKFCVIKRSDFENKENSQLPPRDNRKLSV